MGNIASLDAKMPRKMYHGTLNLVLGNANGIIIATDSCATKASINNQGQVIKREYELNHQKLFAITDSIVVTIAGYGCVSMNDLPEFTAPAAGLILDYIDEIKAKNHSPSYREVIGTLQHIISFHLTSIANIRGWMDKPLNIKDFLDTYEFQMIIIGPNDNNITVTKVIMKMQLQQNKKGSPILSSNVSKITQHNITNSFIFETAGWEKPAREMLTNPKNYVAFDHNVISNYIKHINKDGGNSIECKELLDLAKVIFRQNEKINPGIGGPIQLAIFEKGKMKVNVPNFPRPLGPSIKYSLFKSGGFSNTRLAVTFPPFLFIGTSFDKSGVILDRHYYFGCSFINCNFILNNNVFLFHESNEVVGCELTIQPNVNLNDENVKSIIKRFPNESVKILKHN
jgi:hypothetical protein